MDGRGSSRRETQTRSQFTRRRSSATDAPSGESSRTTTASTGVPSVRATTLPVTSSIPSDSTRRAASPPGPPVRASTTAAISVPAARNGSMASYAESLLVNTTRATAGADSVLMRIGPRGRRRASPRAGRCPRIRGAARWPRSRAPPRGRESTIPAGARRAAALPEGGRRAAQPPRSCCRRSSRTPWFGSAPGRWGWRRAPRPRQRRNLPDRRRRQRSCMPGGCRRALGASSVTMTRAPDRAAVRAAISPGRSGPDDEHVAEGVAGDRSDRDPARPGHSRAPRPCG